MGSIFTTHERPEDRSDDALLHGVLLVAAAVAIAVTAIATSSAALPTLVVVGGGTYLGVKSYAANESRRDLRVPLREAWDAAIDALGETGFLFGEPASCGPTDGRIRAGDALVTVERHPGEFTRIRVRVGTFATDDNRRRAALVLEAAVKHLG